MEIVSKHSKALASLIDGHWFLLFPSSNLSSFVVFVLVLVLLNLRRVLFLLPVVAAILQKKSKDELFAAGGLLF